MSNPTIPASIAPPNITALRSVLPEFPMAQPPEAVLLPPCWPERGLCPNISRLPYATAPRPCCNRCPDGKRSPGRRIPSHDRVEHHLPHWACLAALAREWASSPKSLVPDQLPSPCGPHRHGPSERSSRSCRSRCAAPSDEREQCRRVAQVIQVPPFQLEDLGDPQAGAPHDQDRGAGLVPVVGRQRAQEALDLVCRPIMWYIHGGRLH